MWILMPKLEERRMGLACEEVLLKEHFYCMLLSGRAYIG